MISANVSYNILIIVHVLVVVYFIALLLFEIFYLPTQQPFQRRIFIWVQPKTHRKLIVLALFKSLSLFYYYDFFITKVYLNTYVKAPCMR